MSGVTLADAPGGAAAAAVLAPDMQQLWQRFPPRPIPPWWPATEVDRDRLLDRLLAPPFRLPAHDAQTRRRLGLTRIIDWLAAQPGRTWQQRWQASGAEDLGNDQWWRPLLTGLRADPRCGVSLSSNLRVCMVLLVCADVIRPSLAWVLTPRVPQNLVAQMARCRDRQGFAELTTLCQTFPAGQTMTKAALTRIAAIMAVKGGLVGDITVGDCLEMIATLEGAHRRKNKGMGCYQLLHGLGVFPPAAPATIRAFGTGGQLSPQQLIDQYGIECVPVRELLVEYLRERQPTLDHTSLRSLAFSLGRLFWRDLELHHPGIASLRLPAEVATQWKQRALTTIRRTTGRDGQPVEVRQPRAGGMGNLAAVRAFYLDIAQWAMEDPARWGPWAAPCPIRDHDLRRHKELGHRKARIDQRTRQRLPALPALLARVDDQRHQSAARLQAALDTPPGQPFTTAGQTLRRATMTSGPGARTWAEDPDTGTRRDLTTEETRAFWTWAAVHTLRLTGIRIEELTELSHHSLIQYTLPDNGELIPLLQIAPSKTDTERLLVVSPELADVLSTIICRIRDDNGAVACVASYDSHERRWNPPMPLLFQRTFSIEQRAIPAATIREWITKALHGTGITDTDGTPMSFSPHDFRRIFITDAIMHGMPPHIAQLVAGHRDINTTMGYKAVYPQEVIEGHRAFIARRRQLRPAEEYRTPTEEEWQQFLGHFQHRKVSLGTCGRSYNTPCIHEHSCLRCPLLRPDPAQRTRLLEIRNNLHARIDEARRESWLGEVDGLHVSLNAARQKLQQMDHIDTMTRTTTHLGIPTFPNTAGRVIPATG